MYLDSDSPPEYHIQALLEALDLATEVVEAADTPGTGDYVSPQTRPAPQTNDRRRLGCRRASRLDDRCRHRRQHYWAASSTNRLWS